MTSSVIGADGRRIVRRVDDSYAEELAARLTADTGEAVTVVCDDIVASGIRQRQFAGADPADATANEAEDEAGTAEEPESKPKRSRRTT